MDNQPITIDLTPTWIGVLPALLAALEDGTDEGKRIAREELKHMAQVADLAKSATENLNELRAMLAEIVSQLERREGGDGNAPGHGHEIPGVWDSDNGELAGKPCAWCALWAKAKAMKTEEGSKS